MQMFHCPEQQVQHFKLNDRKQEEVLPEWPVQTISKAWLFAKPRFRILLQVQTFLSLPNLSLRVHIWAGKEATFKDAAFKECNNPDARVSAMAGLTKSSIRDAINEAYKKKVRENRNAVETVADVLLWTATQQGHRETTEVGDRGTPQWGKMKGSQNASCIMQDGIVDIFSNMVHGDIIEEVKQSEVFSIIADQTWKRRNSSNFARTATAQCTEVSLTLN